MTNCLSNSKFANLLFVNVRIRELEATALFDTGAGMTVITQSLLEKLGGAADSGALSAGNSNGLVRKLRTAVISDIRLGDICIGELRVIVTDDSDLDLCGDNGTVFPAGMLLGWDVISRYCWIYSAENGSLTVSAPKSVPAAPDPDTKLGPVVFPEHDGRRFKARVDTGHTGSVLSAVWHTRLPDIERHEAEIVGVGSRECVSVPYVRVFPILFQGRPADLRDVDICGEIYGQPEDIEALLGYDLLEGRSWQLDREFQLL